MNLVTLEEARYQLSIMDTTRDVEIYDIIGRASNIALEETSDQDWQDTSPLVVPDRIRHAVLLMVAEMFMNREASLVDIFSPAVRSLLKNVPGMA